jgi:hypothetical protein
MARFDRRAAEEAYEEAGPEEFMELFRAVAASGWLQVSADEIAEKLDWPIEKVFGVVAAAERRGLCKVHERLDS